MKALIIKKEWLDKIFDEGKIWEMRSTKTKIRGNILLIESGSGTVVGEAELLDCLPPIDIHNTNLFFDRHQVGDIRLLQKWKYPWVLNVAKRYKTPVPYNHPKGAVVWVNINYEAAK